MKPLLFQSIVLPISVLVLGQTLCCVAQTATVSRPNVLLLFADDLGCYASAYADSKRPSPNDIINTPVFDRIAKEGALFQNAFVSSPSCSPSRAALNTGRHFFRNGSHAQLHFPWQKGVPDPFDAIKGMPLTLRDGGYHIGLTYKLHMRPSIIGGKENIYDSAGNNLNKYSRFLTHADDKEAAKQQIIGQVQGNFRNFLAKREKGKPFFYSFNPTNTHRMWTLGSGRNLWGLNPDDLKGKMPPVIPDEPIIREDMADYLGEGMAFDAACGVLIKMIEEMGELDNTIVVISGDHGIPGFPRGKCNVHDLGSRVLLAIRWPKKIAPGRNVKVPVSLIDLAPTLLAAAGLESPDDPDGQSLLPALAPGADDSKLRSWALIGREVHAQPARENNLPYPTRALRTPDFLYVKNFKPDRWPMGDPYGVTETSEPSYKQLANDTYAGFPDIDSSPTKAWLVAHRNDPSMKNFIQYAWGKRPTEELYDLAKDPHQMTNIANDPSYAETLVKLRNQLMTELKAKGDPRLDDDAFDQAPRHLRKHKSSGS
jgi:N-sulfoglucosamine sulfohydrolase